LIYAWILQGRAITEPIRQLVDQSYSLVGIIRSIKETLLRIWKTGSGGTVISILAIKTVFDRALLEV